MKLIKLKISNFRQFYGTQEIEFSTDLAKNVTLIHGENNGGKTALLNALRWCLYEETTENLLDPGELLNKHARSKKTNNFSVVLLLSHNNKLYEVNRAKSRTASSSRLNVYEIKDGCYAESPEKNPNLFINTFLPREMSEYFFYQGEGTGTLNSQNDFSHINDAIDKVLGLTVANKTINHLKSIKSTYEKELKQFDTTNELSDSIANKEALSSNLEKFKNELIRLEAELLNSNKNYEEQISKLARFNKTSIEEHINNRAKKDKLLSDLKRELENIISNKSRNISTWVKSAFSESLGKVDLAAINTEELNKTSRYSVDKNLLKEIIENSECLCGTHVDESNDAGKLIKELSKFSVDHKLKNRWLRAKELKKQLEEIKTPTKIMTSTLSKIDGFQENIEDLNAEIEELSVLIKDSDISDIKEIETAKNLAHKKYQKLSEDIPILKRRIDTSTIDLKDCEQRINKLTLHQPQAQKIKKLANACEEIIKLYKQSIETSKDGVDSILLRKMQDFFSQVAFNGYTVRKDSKGGTFTWVIVDKEGKKVAAGNGYQAMLSISFIIALIQFSNGRVNDKRHLLTPGTVAPFIADSILAFISGDNGRELLKYIAESVEQTIFMFSQAQWTSTTDQGIRDRVGREYNLVQHTVLTEDEFKGVYPTSLKVGGKSYDVVKFNSDFDKVTIEEVPLNG